MRDISKQKGFTLVELMLVVVIIGLLAGLAVPNIMKQLGKAKIGKAQGDITTLDNALSMFAMQVGDYPTTEQGLKALMTNLDNNPEWNGPYLRKGIPSDPWKEAYVYRRESNHENVDFDLYSKGPDKQENTDDDIGNWSTESKVE
ncbi:MAG TPA: type II secretion system major pseudopilin GspG [bacterium]|nr:type II secretion system major pseudopilin GspG [bacterium]